MSLEKVQIDAVLSEWPEPAREESQWEDQAATIVQAATASAPATGAELSALCDAPALPAEAGEPGAQPQAPQQPEVRARSGEKTMSQETDPNSGSLKNDSIRPNEGEPKKKRSLKEIAQRASQSGSMRPGPASGAGRTSQSDIAASTKTPLPTGRASAPSHPASVTPRPIASDKEDSGMVDLKVVQAAAAEKLAAEKAQADAAASGDQDKDGEAKAAATVPSKVDLKVVASAPAAKKGSGGVYAGVAVAVLGLAAAFAIVQMNKPEATTTAAAPAQPESVAEGQPAAAAAKQAAAPAPAAAADTAEAPADAPEKVAAAGPAVAGGPAPAAGAAAANEAPTDEAPAEPVAAANPAPAPAAHAKPGDLASAMQSAVGTTGNTTTSDKAEPAAGGRTGNQNVPEQPPQGAVNAAIRSGMGAAKACVSGADDVSRATVTFSSSGSVSSVSVSGWAAGKGAAGCIKAAFKGTSVAPFSKPSFTVGFTIRP